MGSHGLEMARHEFGNKWWVGKDGLHTKADNINARLPRLWYEFDLELDLKFTKASVSTYHGAPNAQTKVGKSQAAPNAETKQAGWDRESDQHRLQRNRSSAVLRERPTFSPRGF